MHKMQKKTKNTKKEEEKTKKKTKISKKEREWRGEVWV